MYTDLTKGKVLALDYGGKRIGVATGDLEMKVAFPRSIILNKSFDFVSAEILKLCDDLDVKLIVFGWPLSMKEGQENKIMKDLRKFLNKFEPMLWKKNIELRSMDERLSSFEAEKTMAEYNLVGADDMLAAQVILQRFFDSL